MAICNREAEEGGGGIRVEDVVVYKKGAWSKEEDEKLIKAVEEQGIKNWVTIEKTSGLGRPAKNCRLRWLNYLRPNLKKYPFTEEEERLVVELHSKFGNSWARIANKLPGRSDNEIKNFWHKRAKKCRREKLPVYPFEDKLQNQSHTNSSIHHEAINDDYFPTNYPPNNTPYQFQPSTPNIVNIASDAPSIHSPQSIISTPQPQFLSSPTTPLLNTPTSQAHNAFLSSSPSPSFIPDRLQPPLSTQAAATAFTFLRKPAPLLSPSPLRQFLRARTQLPPHFDSSMQMESPRSPLNLKLSPGFPPQYTLQTSTHATESFLNSPTAVPPSPLKLRLSVPLPSEVCFQSNMSIPGAKVELDPSTSAAQAITVDTDHDVHLHSEEEPPSIQFSPPENSQVETGEIMEELRKAQARVRFLKNKLKKSSRNQHLRSACPETTDLSKDEAPPDETSSQSTIKDCASSRTSSRSEDLVGGNAPPKTPRKKDVQRRSDAIGISKPEGSKVKKARKGKTTMSGSSGSKISPEKRLPKEDDSPSEILKRINSEQRPIDFHDHLSSQHTTSDPSSQGFADKCSSSMEGFLGESSALLQEGFFKGDFYGQTSLIENPFSSQRHAPLVDAFAPVYSQSSATKPGDECGQLTSYLQPDKLGLSFMDSCGSDLLMHQNTTSGDLLDFDFLRCDHFSIQNSVGCSSEGQPSFMQLNSSYQTCRQLLEQESETAQIDESGFVQHQIPETSLFDSRYMMGFDHEMEGLLGENLWPQGQIEAHDQTFSVNRVDSVINPMESMMNWNNESTSGGYL